MAADRATAQSDVRPHPSSVDSLVHAFKAEHQIPGLVIGAVDSSGKHVYRYGVAAVDDSVRIQATTHAEIGSVTKPFTALLLAEMVQRGAVDLADPVDQYLPDSVQAPAVDERSIQLQHLATHTSGLPRLPDNFSPANPANPYADYTAADLHAFLDGYTLSRAPGAEYAYSNVGGGLLGHLLARRADTSYAALLRARVLEPLGLENTYVPDASMPPHELASGYGMMGQAAYWRWDVLAGAGALYSTADDLLRFLQAQLRPANVALRPAIRQTHEIRHRMDESQAVTLGWHVATAADGTRTYWHNGGTGGFRSFVGFVPDRNAALVVLANKAVALQPVNEFAFRLLREHR